MYNYCHLIKGLIMQDNMPFMQRSKRYKTQYFNAFYALYKDVEHVPSHLEKAKKKKRRRPGAEETLRVAG